MITRLFPRSKKEEKRNSALQSAQNRKRRGVWVAVCAAPVLMLLLLLLFQYLLYRSNLAVAYEDRPLSAPLEKNDRLLIVSPHCDDETLGAGGIMAAAHELGARVQVVFLTNGDGSRSTRIATDVKSTLKRESESTAGNEESHSEKGQLHGNQFQKIAAMRQAEALAACKVLGVASEDVIFLGYPDGGLQPMWERHWSPQNAYYSRYTRTSRSPYANSLTPQAPYSGAQLVNDLATVFREFRPTVVMTTHPEDTHPDHWSAYAYTAAALEQQRLKELKSSSRQQQPVQPVRLLTFLVHHGIWPVPHGYYPEAALSPPASLRNTETQWLTPELSERQRNLKKESLEKYSSQLVWTPRYLRSFIRRNELFGAVPVHYYDASDLGQSSLSSIRLLLNRSSDSPWREAWPSADIQSLHLQNSVGTFTIRTDLARAMSARVRYRFALHGVSAGEIRSWRIEARRSGKNVRASLIAHDTNAQALSENSSVPLKTRLTARGFEFDLPKVLLLPEKLSEMEAPATYFISAATFARHTRLGQTPTAIIQGKMDWDERKAALQARAGVGN